MRLRRKDRVIDSRRLAALHLGYHGRLLRAVQERVYDGDDKGDEEEMVAQRFPLEDAAFVLLAGEAEAQYRAFEDALATIGNCYGDAIWAPEGAREFHRDRQRHEWEKLDLLRRRAVDDDGPLASCFGVGNALATLMDGIMSGRIAVPIAESEFDDLRAAAEGLPAADRGPAIGFLPEPKEDLTLQIGEMLDYLATLEQLLARPEEVEEVVGTTPAPVPSFPLKPYHEDVLSVLDAVGHRMTSTQFLGALARAGKDFSESTYKQAFAYLISLGRLENCPRCVPKGYGLPGWGHDHPGHPSR